jgi:hypothetical protein
VRLTSGFFVSALIRRSFAEGAPAVVQRRGAEEAGAIFIAVDRLDGANDLYGQAPQTVYDDRPSDRLFQKVLSGVTAGEMSERLGREIRYDPDLWIVAIEDRAGRSFVELVPA